MRSDQITRSNFSLPSICYRPHFFQVRLALPSSIHLITKSHLQQHHPHRLVITAASPTQTPMTQQDETKIKKELLKKSRATSIVFLSRPSWCSVPPWRADSSGALGQNGSQGLFSQFQMAAKHGHAEAAYRTALCLEKGWGASNTSAAQLPVSPPG